MLLTDIEIMQAKLDYAFHDIKKPIQKGSLNDSRAIAKAQAVKLITEIEKPYQYTLTNKYGVPRSDIYITQDEWQKLKQEVGL